MVSMKQLIKSIKTLINFSIQKNNMKTIQKKKVMPKVVAGSKPTRLCIHGREDWACLLPHNKKSTQKKTDKYKIPLEDDQIAMINKIKKEHKCDYCKEPRNLMIAHGEITHPINDKCDVCDKVKLETEPIITEYKKAYEQAYQDCSKRFRQREEAMREIIKLKVIETINNLLKKEIICTEKCLVNSLKKP